MLPEPAPVVQTFRTEEEELLKQMLVTGCWVKCEYPAGVFSSHR